MGADRPDVTFRLLGLLEVVVDGKPVPVRAAKVRTVLAVLLLGANRAVSTDKLLDVLWGDDPPVTAKNTLHTYVSQIRKVVGGIETRHPGYLLALDRHQLDVTRFDDLAAEGRAALGREPERAAATLREALDLWRGPPFADFADQPFARAEIARLEEARLAALEDRISADLATGRHTAVIGELEALIAAHPLREQLAAHLMLALYRCGRQAEALRAYQRLRRDLAEELGIDPSPPLVRLEEAVLSQAAELERPSDPPARPASDLDWARPTPLPFVGRTVECALLAESWSQEGEELRVVLVEGEPGVGKTRLLAEAAGVADHAGHLVLYGRGDEHLTDAYRLLSRALQRLQPAGESWHPADATPADDADARRLRFFTAAAAALAGASSRRLVLVLDDLQWADVPSLLLLRHLVLDAPPFPMTVLAVLGVGPREPVLTGTVTDLERLGLLRRVQLDGLRAEDVGRLVALSETALDQDLVPRLWSDTGGNALFVTEVIRDLAGATSGWAWPVLPATIPGVVARRLRALSDSAQALLVGAAVLATPGDGPLLGRIAELDDEGTVAALDEAVVAKLLMPVAVDPGSFEFGHRMVRAAIYEEVPSARRLLLHRRIALAMEADSRGPERPAELARHWVAAGRFGDPAAATRYLRAAGDAADRRTGYEAAVGHYRSALALMDQHPRQVDPVDRCEVLLAIAATENRSGDVNAGKEACRSAADLAGRLGRSDLLARAALEYGGLLPTGADLDDPVSAQLLRRALDALEPETTEAALVAARLADLEYWLLPRAERRALCDGALATARRLGDRRVLTEVVLHRFWALNCPDELDERLALAEELDRLAQADEDRELWLQTGKCRLHLLLEIGDFDAACRLSDRMAATARELNHREYERLCLAFDAMRAGARGEYEDAQRLIEDARTTMHRRGNPTHAQLVAFLQRISMWWLQGRLGELVGHAEALVQAEPSRLFWRALLAWALAERGDLAEARTVLPASDVSAFVARDPSLDWWSVLAAGSHVAVLVDDTAMGEVVYDALLPYAGRNLVGGQIAFYGAVAHALGVLAAAAGDVVAARTHLLAARKRHEQMGAAPFVALTSAELARLPDGGEGREAEELATVAAGTAERLGLAHVARRLSQGVGRRATA